MSSRKISFLLPTRGRTAALKQSIESLLSLADMPRTIQICIGFDRDDVATYDYFVEHIQPLFDQYQAGYVVMKFNPMGYANLHKYSNTLAKHTGNSDWLIIWNDDTVMQTPGWDTVIQSRTGQFKLLAFHTHQDHPYSIFPVVPRKWYELLDYISPHPSQDAWVSQQAYMLDIWERIPVNVLHDRHDITGNNADDTFKNRIILEGNPKNPWDFHSQQMLEFRHRDCEKLAKYMKSQGISTEFFENIFKGVQNPWEKLAQNDVNSQMVQFKNPHLHFQQ
jgi:ribosomal protein S15P/S13E